MRVDEMHLQFKLAVDKADSLNSPNFLPEEIDVYLSDAQEQFISQRAYGNNFKREALEETQKRVKDLQSLTKNYEVAPLASTPDNKPNGVFVELPSDYRYALNEEALGTQLDCHGNSTSVRVKLVALTHDKYSITVDNPFSKPDSNSLYRLPYGRYNSKEHFEIVSSPDITVTKYILRYLKNPEKINKAQRIIPPAVTPYGLSGTAEGDLSDASYREIIRIAVRNALGDIESPRVQESMQRTNEVE